MNDSNNGIQPTVFLHMPGISDNGVRPQVIIAIAAFTGIATLIVSLQYNPDGRALAAYHRKLQDAGEPTDLHELQGWLQKQCPSNPADLAAWINLMESMRETNATDPAMSGWLDEAERGPLSPDFVARGRDILNHYADRLSMLQEIARSGREFHLMTDLDRSESNMYRWACYVRTLLNAAHVQAILAAHRGDTDQAVDAIHLAFWITDAATSAPLLLDWLIRIGAQRDAAQRLTALLPSLNLTESHRRLLRSDLSRAQDVDPALRLFTTLRTLLLIEAVNAHRPMFSGAAIHLTGAATQDFIGLAAPAPPAATLHEIDAILWRLKINSVEEFTRWAHEQDIDRQPNSFVRRYPRHVQAMRCAAAMLAGDNSSSPQTQTMPGSHVRGSAQ